MDRAVRHAQLAGGQAGHHGRRWGAEGGPCAQVTMKLQLVYEEPYAGYPDAEVVKSPSPVPRTVRGGVDLSVFNSGSGTIKARTCAWVIPPASAAGGHAVAPGVTSMPRRITGGWDRR